MPDDQTPFASTPPVADASGLREALKNPWLWLAAAAAWGLVFLLVLAVVAVVS